MQLNNQKSTNIDKIKSEAFIKIDEELYFLTQDGYAIQWSEDKKNYIKDIVNHCIDDCVRYLTTI